MKYLIKPTKNGWYIAVNNTWKDWSLRAGWFTLLELIWCGELYKHNNPRYFSINTLGFELEIGKFEGGK